jgi:hypothetical protein
VTDIRTLLAEAHATREAARRSYFDAMTAARRIERDLAPQNDYAFREGVLEVLAFRFPSKPL